MRACKVTIALSMTLLLGGCERAMHDMYQQPKDKPQARNSLFANDDSARQPPAGSVPAASGAAADTSSGRQGSVALPAPVGPALPLDDEGRPIADGTREASDPLMPLPVTMPLLNRGRERFNIYCAPCHGRSGDGQGMVVQRGFPAPPSYHSQKLRHASDGHFYQVITHGYGVMYPYADRVDPQDRWAIVAYIRALQLSQHAPRNALDMDDIRQLEGASAGAAR